MTDRNINVPFPRTQVGWCRFHQNNVLDRLFRFCEEDADLRDCDMVSYV